MNVILRELQRDAINPSGDFFQRSVKSVSHAFKKIMHFLIQMWIEYKIYDMAYGEWWVPW